MRLMVLGNRGQLGSKIMERFHDDHEVLGLDLPQTDITHRESIEAAAAAFRPDAVINCAAYTDVEGAESHPEDAYLVNARAVQFAADVALEHGARLFHISTDYVFSGLLPATSRRTYHEEDLPGPINVYGASKLAGEICLQSHAVASCTLRTAWLYGGPSRNFLQTILERGKQAAADGKPLRVVNDQVGTPTDAWSLARQVERLLEEDVRGIVHASCRGEASWYDFACEILRRAGVGVSVEPVPSSAYPTAARRPARSVLENRRLEALGLDVMPPWQQGLAEALERLGA